MSGRCKAKGTKERAHIHECTCVNTRHMHCVEGAEFRRCKEAERLHKGMTTLHHCKPLLTCTISLDLSEQRASSPSQFESTVEFQNKQGSHLSIYRSFTIGSLGLPRNFHFFSFLVLRGVNISNL
jgi:hypothetical protein